MPTSPPNIVLIMCDQLRHDCGGFAGHALVQTPHLDRLAQTGAMFENAYCASPVCSPARASWLTGTYPHCHGQLVNYGPARATSSGARMRPGAVTIGDVLKAEGYRCGLAGPWHLGDDPEEQAAQVMVRHGRWKYLWNRFDEDELYDLERDPLEWTNCCAAESARREEMRNRIRTMLKRTGPGPYAWCMTT